VGVDRSALGFDFFFRVTIYRQAGVIGIQEVPDCHLHCITRGFLFPPLRDLQFFGFQKSQEFHRNGFDAFDLGGGEVGFAEQFEDGEGFLVQAFVGGAGFLFGHGLLVFQKSFEGLLLGDAVFFLVALAKLIS
jgi:hypothetical protein